jgi:hypothetical protein
MVMNTAQAGLRSISVSSKMKRFSLPCAGGGRVVGLRVSPTGGGRRAWRWRSGARLGVAPSSRLPPTWMAIWMLRICWATTESTCRRVGGGSVGGSMKGRSGRAARRHVGASGHTAAAAHGPQETAAHLQGDPGVVGRGCGRAGKGVSGKFSPSAQHGRARALPGAPQRGGTRRSKGQAPPTAAATAPKPIHRLNSSKHAQAPLLARPLKNLACGGVE